jgi:chromosome segregation ATPase
MPSGGHEVGIPNRRVFPIPFLLRHYPIRGQAHGRRKVFSDRRGRFVDRERARQWHIQYDAIEESHDFLADPATLRPFDADQVRLELMLDNVVTRHEKWLAGRAQKEAEHAAEMEQRARDQEILAKERAKRVADLEHSAAEAGERVVELERALGREEGRREELEKRIRDLEEERDRKG